jgi:hypothetical protein
MPWHTVDPFRFSVHRGDIYPGGDAQPGLEASVEGRQIGQGFANGRIDRPAPADSSNAGAV